MKKNITITRQDGEQKPVSAVIGEAIIGRALVANCRDQRISRRHGLITVSDEGEMLLTPKEKMYYIPFGQVKRQVLYRGTTVALSDGDRFSFLPQKFCFLIKISDVSKGKERKRNIKHVLESGNVLKGQCDQDDITPEEPKRMKLLETMKPQPSTSTGDDDEENQQKVEQKQQKTNEDSDANIRDQNESSMQEQYIQDFVPETREKPLSSPGVDEEDIGQEEQSTDEKPGKVEEESNVSDINQEQGSYDDEEADIVYPEAGVPSKKQNTNMAEENEDEYHRKETNEPKSSTQYVFGPSSNLKPLQEFWSRGILSAPANSGEPKMDKPRYPEENVFQEDDYRPLCPRGKACFNRTREHRQDFRHDIPEPQVKSHNTSSN